jgi:hypothetical protein
LEEVLKRARYFQDIQQWPLNSKLDYDGWLSNFKSDREKEIGYALLNALVYYSEGMVIELLKKSLILSSNYIKGVIKEWDVEHLFNNTIFSYMPGERSHITDSGVYFVRILKKVFQVHEDQIYSPFQLIEKIEYINSKTPIIFVDDFVGTGSQARKAWNDKNTNDMSLGEILHNHIAIYCPLVCNYRGHANISEDCKGLKLVTNHILGEEYDINKEGAFCWNGDKQLFNDWKEFSQLKGRELGIYSYCSKTNDILGYCCQGLTIAFNHGVPDATTSLFTHKAPNWKPLINY